MNIFLDPAEVKEIRETDAWSIIDDVTTNPSLVANSERSLEEVIKEICTIGDGPIVEIVSVDGRGMNVFQQLVKHSLADIGLERFLADYHKSLQR